MEYGVDSVSDHEGKDVHEVKYGGIFKFLEGPDVQDSEHNLIAALDCYDAAKNATNGDTIDSEELLSIVKKKGWVYNELGRHRLKKGDLNSAELAFSDAIKIFRKVSDYTNIVLINCNLGHGRRAMAEQMVSKLEMLKDHGYAYKQLMKTAKIEYIRSLKYYEAANFELNDMTRETDSLLRNEVHTQFAHTYLRFGMLLSKEDISTDTHGKESEGPPLGHARNTERAKLRKHEMSTTDAFGKALAIYESLGELRRQEAAFAHFQLACYHRDFSLKYISTDSRQAKHPNIERMHASLAEKHWQKSLSFYGPQTHPLMYLNILLELSTLLLSLSVSFDSPTMLESALLHLLEGRHAVREEDLLGGQEIEVREKFWNHLQTLLKRMLVAALRGGTNGTQSHGHTGSAEYAAKIKEMYRMSLKSASLCQLHSVYRMWISSS